MRNLPGQGLSSPISGENTTGLALVLAGKLNAAAWLLIRCLAAVLLTAVMGLGLYLLSPPSARPVPSCEKGWLQPLARGTVCGEFPLDKL